MGVKVEAPKVNTTVIQPSKTYTGDTKVILQIRIPGESPIKLDIFNASTTIEQLCEHLKNKHNMDYAFSLIFMNKPLLDLSQSFMQAGLVPRAALNVIKDEEKGKVVKGEEIVVNNPYGGRGRGRGRGNPFFPPGINPHINPNPIPMPQPQPQPQPNRNRSIVSIYKRQDTDEDCVICQSPLADGEEIRTLSCLHFFHKECYDEINQEGAACPTCEIQNDNNQDNLDLEENDY